ncbi:hypothetical protein, partial [Paracoccus rhizosphaerae]
PQSHWPRPSCSGCDQERVLTLKGALDFEYRVEKDGARLDVVNTKMKDASPPDDLHFTLESVHLQGDAVSAVLRQADAPPRKERRTPTQTLAIKTYQDAARTHGVWSGSGSSFRGVHVDQWRDAFYAKHTGDNAGAKRQAFHRVRTELVNSGTMTVQDDVYLVVDQTALASIFAAAGSGVTRVTERDTAEDVTAPDTRRERDTRDMPLRAVTLSRPDCARDVQERGDNAECHPVTHTGRGPSLSDFDDPNAGYWPDVTNDRSNL